MFDSAYLEWPASLLTGDTSVISSASVYRVKSLGTSHTKTLPSSEPEAMIRSLKGFLRKMSRQHLSHHAAAQELKEKKKKKKRHRHKPVSVQNSSRMPPEQRNLIGQLALLVQGNHSKGTTAGRIPIDRQILGVNL